MFKKNGFHLHFPYTFLSKVDQEVHLLPRVKKIIKEMNIFNDIGIKNSDSLIDKSYTRVPWLLYGGCKDENMGSYLVTSIFDANCEQIDLYNGFRDYKIYNNEENQGENGLNFFL